eukprot:tig00021687_g23113.t1
MEAANQLTGSWAPQQPSSLWPQDSPAQALADSTFRLLKRNLYKHEGSFYGADAFRVDPTDKAVCYTMVSEQRYRLALTSTDPQECALWKGVQLKVCLRYADTRVLVETKREGKEKDSSASTTERSPRDFPFVYFSDSRPGPEPRVEMDGEVTESGEASFTFALAATSFLHGRRWFWLDITCDGASKGLAVRGVIKMYVKARGSSESKKMMVDGMARYPLMLPGEPDPATQQDLDRPDSPSGCVLTGAARKRRSSEHLQKPTKVSTVNFQIKAEGEEGPGDDGGSSGGSSGGGRRTKPRPQPHPSGPMYLEGGRVVQQHAQRAQASPAQAPMGWAGLTIQQQLHLAMAHQQAQHQTALQQAARRMREEQSPQLQQLPRQKQPHQQEHQKQQQQQQGGAASLPPGSFSASPGAKQGTGESGQAAAAAALMQQRYREALAQQRLQQQRLQQQQLGLYGHARAQAQAEQHQLEQEAAGAHQAFALSALPAYALQGALAEAEGWEGMRGYGLGAMAPWAAQALFATQQGPAAYAYAAGAPSPHFLPAGMETLQRPPAFLTASHDAPDPSALQGAQGQPSHYFPSGVFWGDM